jgi:hypothetical protein
MEVNARKKFNKGFGVSLLLETQHKGKASVGVEI